MLKVFRWTFFLDSVLTLASANWQVFETRFSRQHFFLAFYRLVRHRSMQSFDGFYLNIFIKLKIILYVYNIYFIIKRFPKNLRISQRSRNFRLFLKLLTSWFQRFRNYWRCPDAYGHQISGNRSGLNF